MHTMEFLRAIFPFREENAGEVVRFIAVDQQDIPWPGRWHWRSRGEIHASDEQGIAGLGFAANGLDLYLTPHAFIRRDLHVTKDDAAPLCDVAWVELDDADIPPETFTPLPSIVVATSTGRHHLYWLLDEPLPSVDVERINYRLTYGNGLRKDTSGWALTKLLRVPGSVSYKRQEPFAVEIVFADLDRRYGPDDFHDLPEAPEFLTAHTTRPLPEMILDRDDLLTRYAISRELNDLLLRRMNDRSQALWRIYNLCFRQGMTEEECFSLVVGTPNDKFTGWRYNGAEGLWTDILRGYHMAVVPEDTPVLTELRLLRGKKMIASDRRREIAHRIAKDLSERGRIFFDPERRDALYYDGHRVTMMEPTDRAWKVLLNTRYHITDGEDEYRPVNANLYAIAAESGEPVSPKTFAYWDRERWLLYVYAGDGYLYRIDGVSVERAENGADGVLFRDVGDDPFQPDWGALERPGPTLETAILSLPNYVDEEGVQARTHATLLLRCWFFGVFFAEHLEARPHLVIAGPTASGKSVGLQAITEFLSGPKSTVSTIPSDRKEFEVTVSNRRYVFFDNVDTPNKWMMDSLAEVATGMQFSRKVLYTTNEIATYRAQCFIGMTTRDPWFSRADIATRLIPIHVERRSRFANPSDLFDVIRQGRGRIWAEVLNDLNGVVAGLKARPVGREHTLRMAGFAEIVQVVSKIVGRDPTPILQFLSGAQVNTALEHSAIWTVLEPWLRTRNRDTRQYDNSGRWISTSDLHRSLQTTAETIGYKRQYDGDVFSPKAFSHQIRELVPDLEQVVDVEYRKRQPANEYRFTLRFEHDITEATA